MPNNKRHTLKTIKNKETMHPSSRRAQQVMRVVLRKDRLEQRHRERVHLSNPIAERILWFRYAVSDEIESLTRPEMHQLIDEYLARNNEELEQLKALHRPGKVRPKAAREDLLAALIEREHKEYVSGIEIPDFTSPKNVKLLRAWEGDMNSVKRIRMIKLIDPKHMSKIVAQTAEMVEAKDSTMNE
ncbi:hypothetical protein DFQ27_001979 [Actinomortierella ambigua]|uniref:Translation machinery-associated protein 16 n=1 Tax=Actinomortierella ambigua TaxID=1343610 RepID=A0A9P6QD92_9FUNG|nr:hypothetical protein DFQ27_001979 [Actinomortierella ambigua]